MGQGIEDRSSFGRGGSPKAEKPHFLFDHLGINVRDLDRALEFYEDVLGLHLSRVLELEGYGVRMAYLKAPGLTLEIFERGSTEHANAGLAHVAFAVDDLDEVCAQLTAKGVALSVEPRASKVDPKKRFAFARDPGGVLIELIES